MKSTFVAVYSIILFAYINADDLVCFYEKPILPQEWIKMDAVCIAEVRKLVSQEMYLATQYFAMSAYQYRVNVSRWGVGRVFLESADHHRHNAKRLIDYLTMRGQNVQDINTLISIYYTPAVTEWASLISAMEFALKNEADTTDHYRHVIGVCEDQSFSDYNLNNWLTKEFLYNLYSDMKWYADKTSTIIKVNRTNGQYADFLVDVGFENEFCLG